MTFRLNGAEGQTSGTALTAANSGAGAGDTAFDTVTKTGTGAIAFDSAQAMHGSESYHVTAPAATDTAFVTWAGAINSATVALRFYIRFNSLPGATLDIATIRNSGAVAAKVQISSANKFVVANAAGLGFSSFPTAVTTGVWYRIELEVAPGGTTSTGYIAGRYFLGDATTPVDTAVSSATTNAGTTNITNTRIGKITTTASTLDAWFDDLAFDDASTTPIGPPSTPATGTASLSLSGTAVTVSPASASLALTSATTAAAAAAATGAVALSGTAASTAPATTTAALALSGSGSAGQAAGGGGTLSLSAVATARAAATASAALSLAGTAAARAAAAGSAALSLAGSATARVSAIASALLTLSGSGSATGPAVGFIGATVDDNGTPQTSRTLTLPTGTVASGYGLIVMASASGASYTMTATGWTQIVSVAASNMYVVALIKKLDAGDIATGSITVTTSSVNHPVWLVTFGGLYTAIDPSVSLPLSSSFYGTRGGVSQTFVDAPDITPTNPAAAIIVGVERTTSTGTTLNTLTFGTVDYDNEANVVANTSLAIGHAPLTAGVASGANRLTYSAASGNGLAFMLPLTVTATATIRAATAKLGLAIAGAVVRAATAVLYSPRAIYTRAAGAWVPGLPHFAQTAAPFTLVTLPAGHTWTQTSGPTVTLSSGTFTAPAFEAGATLVFSEGANTATVTVTPWNFFYYGSTGMTGVRPTKL